MGAPSPVDVPVSPSPLNETARGSSHRRPSNRPVPTSVTQSAGTHPRPALAATTPNGTTHPHGPPSSRVLMQQKGSDQINVVDQHTLSDKQHHHSQSQLPHDADDAHCSTENIQEPVHLGTTKRARWTHQMKLSLIELLKEHDVPGFRTHNAWTKDAWTNIVRGVNAKFGTSYSVSQVKQQEQDLKKAYRSVKNLLAESGFRWDQDRMMVTAPASVWASFTARQNNKDALHWQDRSFLYYDALSSLYDGRHAEGRTRQGMDHYASKAKNVLISSTETTQLADTYNSPSPTLNALGESDLQFHIDEETEEANLDVSQLPSNHVHQPQAAPTSKRMHTEATDSRRGNKKQKSKVARPDDGFHERCLKLKKVAAIEKKLEDPYSINKCVNVAERLHGLQIGEILVAADIFKCKENRELFLSFSTDELRLAWLKREIGREQTKLQDVLLH